MANERIKLRVNLRLKVSRSRRLDENLSPVAPISQVAIEANQDAVEWETSMINRTRFVTLAAPVMACAAVIIMVAGTASASAPRARRARAVQDTSTMTAISVNGQKMTMAQYEAALDQDVRQALGRYGSFGIDPRSPELRQIRTRVEPHTRERLINWLALKDAATRAHVRIPNDSVTQAWSQVTSRFDDDSELQSALRDAGKTREQLMNDLRENLTIDRFLQGRLGVIEVTETEVRAFFEENKERYAQPEVVRARHILIRDTDALARIRAIKARLDRGADFAEEARQHSQDGSGQNGGDLGFFQRGRMVPSFETAAFLCPVGQVTAPVQTQFGWHLIKVEEHRAAQTALYEERREDASRRALETKRQEKIKVFIEGLRRRATVRVNLPALPAVSATEESIPLP